MRLTANIIQSDSESKRLMIYESKNGVYLFLYKTLNDSSANSDYWFENLEEAIESCIEDYGIQKSDFSEIPDPLENCQHDWIEPTRIKGRNLGKPDWGNFEKLVNGNWIDI